MSRFRWYGPTLVLVGVVVLLLVAGPGIVSRITYAAVAADSSALKQQLSGDPSLAKLSDAFRKVAEAVEPSVVHIEVFRRQSASENPDMNDLFHRFGPFLPPGMAPPDEDTPQPMPTPRRGQRNNPDMNRYNVPQQYASGSGWVYDRSGHLITNNHVVNGAEKIVVRFNDGTERTATVVGTDPKTDVAVIKVTGDSLVPATLAGKPVQQGDIVFAFGSPFQFEFSMSQGIVSGKGRHLGILNDQGYAGYEDFIQTDAAINPGNSGGPLVDIHGDVVGMNTAIASRTGTYNGLGFAIPAPMIQEIADQLIKSGKVARGYVGILLHRSEDFRRMAQTFGYKDKGALVDDLVPGGPAETGGVKNGDIITKIDGTDITSADQLRSLVAAMPAGKSVAMEVYRGGNTVKLTVKIAAQPTEMAGAEPRGSSTPSVPGGGEKDTQTLRELGLEGLADMTPDRATQMNLPFESGVLVTRVRPDSAAEAAQIERGSIITDVAGVKVTNVKELAAEVAKQDLAKGVRITVVEGGHARYTILSMEQ